MIILMQLRNVELNLHLANCTSKILIKATITEPATVAIPAVIKISNSLLESLLI